MKNGDQEDTLVKQRSSLCQVTSLSKYLTMIILIATPFLGGWIGYRYAPEKVVTIEKTVENDTNQNNDEFSIQTFLPVTINNWNISKYKFLSQSDTLHVFIDDPNGIGIEHHVVEGLLPQGDFGMFEFDYLGSEYMKNDQQVIYVGSGSSVPRILLDADVKSFKLFELSDRQAFGIDVESVYFRDQKLEDIDPSEVEFIENDSYSLAIVHDSDTYWYPSGDCHLGTYRLGSAKELKTYEFPCQ